MSDVIIYKQDSGTVAVIYPSPDFVDRVGLNNCAKYAVPYGKPYAIVDSALVPTERKARDAWTVDDADLVTGVGADYGVGSINEVVSWNNDGTPVLK